MNLQMLGAMKESREAMEQIVSEHYATIYRFCARRVGPDLASDAAQETFLTAQKTMKRFRGESSLATWLMGIANNHCRAIARKNRFEVDFRDAFERPDPAAPSESALVDAQALRVAMKQLTNEHREVIVLHEIEGLSYDECAVVLGVPSGTVKSRLHHAFVSLRRSMGVYA